jgi:hypothetical protein
MGKPLEATPNEPVPAHRASNKGCLPMITAGEFAFGNNLFLRGRDHAALAEFELWQRKTFPVGRILQVTEFTGSHYLLWATRLLRVEPREPQHRVCACRRKVDIPQNRELF